MFVCSHPLPPHCLLHHSTPLRWHSLGSRALATIQSLSLAQEQARVFHTNWSDLLNRLNEADKVVLAEWTPHSSPEACQADIDVHRGIIDKTSAFQSAVSALKEEGKELKAQGSQDDQILVDQWLDSVKQSFKLVMAHSERKMVCVCVYYYYY